MSVVGRSPVSDVVKSLKALDPKWQIREADIGLLALQWQGKTTKHQSARPNARGLPSHGETGLLVGSNEQRNKVKPSNCRALVWLRPFYLAATAFDWPTLMAEDRAMHQRSNTPVPNGHSPRQAVSPRGSCGP